MWATFKIFNFWKNWDTVTFYSLIKKWISESKVQSIAVCAGSGSSVLAGSKADLWITGEMSHHEVLHAIHTGTSVILCEHSNTERGFLKVFASKLSCILENLLSVEVSEIDEDPLKIMWNKLRFFKVYWNKNPAN